MASSDSTPDEQFAIQMKKLVEVAAEDGIITEDERTVLKNIEISMREFTEHLKEALEDGIITPEEVDSLKKLKAKILKEAFDVANLDDKITTDELKILMTFVVSLNLPSPTESSEL